MKILLVAVFLTQIIYCSEIKTCSICHEKYDDTQLTRTTQCKHTFHKKCLNEWLDNSNRPNCPLCRKDVPPQHDLNYSLWNAAALGENKKVKKLIMRGAEVNEADINYGNTALSLAVVNQHESTVNLLLDRGANVNAIDQRGNTVLHVAAQRLNEAIVKALLAKKPNVNSKNALYGETPLMRAAAKGNCKNVKLLLNAGADHTLKDDQGKTAYDHAKDLNVTCKRLLSPQNLLNYSLRNAVLLGENEEVERLIGAGAEVNAAFINGNNLLYFAVLSQSESTVNLLLDKGADLNTGGFTALHAAVIYGDEAFMKILLKRKPNVNAKTKKGMTSLMFAAKNGMDAKMNLLLYAGADPTLKDNQGKTAYDHARNVNCKKLFSPQRLLNFSFRNAVSLGENKEVKRLITVGAEVNGADITGKSALHLAVSNQHESTVNLLLDSGANVNAVAQKDVTPLHSACYRKNEAIVKSLLAKKPNINAQNINGQTPLMYAVSQRMNGNVMLLLNAGADANLKDNKRKKAGDHTRDDQSQRLVNKQLELNKSLRTSAYLGEIEDVKRVITEGAKINGADIFGNTALHFAVRNQHESTVDFLLDSGANVNAPDHNDVTALHMASSRQNEAIVKSLLAKKPNINAQNISGQTPLVYAAKKGVIKNVEILLKAGANAKLKDSKGKTAGDLYAKNDQCKIELLTVKK